ncbi:MAG: TVP38/TMEM64 family protein [Vicinamibacterales bacterium]
MGREFVVYLPEFAQAVRALGPWGPALFIVGYGVAAVLFVPGALLTIAAGAVFGLGRGILFVMAGATVGATAAFLIGRYLARGFIERHLHGRPRLAAVDRAVARQGFRIVVLLRMSPVIPYTLLNYTLGLSQVRLGDYVTASIGMLPATVVYVYAGKVAGDIASVASGASPAHGAGYYTLLALGLASTIAVSVVVTRTAQKAVKEAVGETSDPEVESGR